MHAPFTLSGNGRFYHVFYRVLQILISQTKWISNTCCLTEPIGSKNKKNK
jgi:hypothetical protein